MDYALRILLEEKVNIEEELKITDKEERRNPIERRLISIANALNKLNKNETSKVTHEDNNYKAPSKIEEVVMNEIWGVFNDTIDDELMLSFNDMQEIEDILIKYKQSTQ